jgi:hypothetical protein
MQIAVCFSDTSSPTHHPDALSQGDARRWPARHGCPEIWAHRSSADVGEDESRFPQFGITRSKTARGSSGGSGSTSGTRRAALASGTNVYEGRDADALGRRRIQHIDANLWLILGRLP